MSQNDPFGRIRILPNSAAASALEASHEQTETWQKWLQKAKIQSEIQNKEEEKKSEQKKQIEKAIELNNAEQQINKKAQQYLFLALGYRQQTHQLTVLKNLEEADLLDRPSPFKSRGAQRYRDWLKNNSQQPHQIAGSSPKEPNKDTAASESQATQHNALQDHEQSSMLRQQQIKDLAKNNAQQENKKASNKDNDADQSRIKSDQLTQIAKDQGEKQNKDKKEASKKSTLTETSQRDQPVLEKEKHENQDKSEEASKNQDTEPRSMQESAAQQQENSAQLDELKLSAASQLNRSSARTDKSENYEVDNEQQQTKEEDGEGEREIAESSEQKTHSNSTDPLPSPLSQIFGVPTEKAITPISQGNLVDAGAHSSPHQQEPGAASQATPIHALTAKELLSRTGPLGQLIEAVSKFCSKRAVNELGDWELIIDLDPKLLPATKLIACISVSELLLRFTSTDAATNTLISRHSEKLCDELAKHLKRLNYPRSVEIELNGQRLRGA